MNECDERVPEDGDRELEIAHVLFIDIVGYSKRLVNEQTALVKRLTELVRGTEQFQKGEAAGKLITIPTGDGMVLVFFTTPDAPVRCATQLSQADKDDPKIELRMGIHSGPVDRLADVNARSNVTGAGINVAQRVMDCGDSGHILLSQRVAEDLAQYANWKPHLYSLGEVEVKHGLRLTVFNFYSDNFGRSDVPVRLKEFDRARRATEHAGRRRATKKKLAISAALALLILAALAGSYRFLVQRAERIVREQGLEIPAKSIAVLPFENLSPDQANAFLAGGIQDEIITQLSKIGDLKVISRTSTMQYGSKPTNLRQIAKELGVAAILEGSVQKIANQIHVNVQLIKAATDAHLWAETYDRELIDLLKAQSEIAQRVASELNTTLTVDERARIEANITTNPDAYAHYLKGTEVLRRPAVSADRVAEGQHHFEQAIALDPKFALAHARLAQIHTRIAIFFDPSPIHKEQGKSQAEEALRLQPNLSEGHLALGLYYGRLARDYDAALREYDLAGKTAPNDIYIPYGIAWVERKRGHFRTAIAKWERTTNLDPMNWLMHNNLGDTYGDVHMFAAAEKAKRRAAELVAGPSPEKFESEIEWGRAYEALTGSFEKLEEIVTRYASSEDPNGAIVSTRFDTLMAQRKYAEAQRAMAASRVSIFEGGGGRVTRSFLLGLSALAQGDKTKAQPLFESELEFARNQASEQPDSGPAHAQLGLTCALLGRKEEAIAEGKRAIELIPLSKDAVDGPGLVVNLAQIYTWLGEYDLAMDFLEQSAKTPGGILMVDLKIRWEWDPLRSDRRFLKLVNGPPPKIVYN